MTNPGTTRLNVVVSKAPIAIRLRKLRTDSGALSGYISISISPASVSSLTHFDARVLTSALSNGSEPVCGVGVGRAFVFAGSGVGDAAWPKASPAENTTARINVKQACPNIEYIFGKSDSRVKY